jgi:molybdopterin converting factor subunit 1
MRIRVRLFAILKDKAGVSEMTLDLSGAPSAADAVAEVGRRYPAVAAFLPRVAIAVNQAYAPPTSTLQDGDEVALIPPVSGG